MNPFLISQFQENKERLRAAYVEICGDKEETEFSFSQIFNIILSQSIPFPAQGWKWDPDTIAITGNSGPFGNILAFAGSHATGLYMAEVSYGSCDSCDVVDYINQYCINKEERQRRIEALMAFSLHVVQQLKPFVFRDVDSFERMKEIMFENNPNCRP